MKYILHYDYAALFVSSAILFHFVLKKRISTKQTKVFLMLLSSVIISNFSDIASAYIISYSDFFPSWINRLTYAGYLLFCDVALVCYLWYVLIALELEGQLWRAHRIFIFCPIAIVIGLLAMNPFNDWVFYCNKEGAVVHGNGLSVIYIVAFCYMLIVFGIAFVHRKQITTVQIGTMAFYTACSLVAIVIQMMKPELLILELAVTLSVFLVYLSLENPEDFTDKRLGTYNNVAFMEVYKKLLKKEKQFQIVGIQVEGLKYISETFGVTVGNQLMHEIAQFLIFATKEMEVYHLEGSRFVMMGACDEEQVAFVLRKIHQRFREAFSANGVAVNLSALMCTFSCPDKVKRLEDAIDMIEYSLLEAKTSGSETVIYADTEILEKGHRESQIIQLLKTAVQERGFEVYYQPIYSVSKGRYSTAEALVRLKSREMGFVSPEEFISLAEKNGLILDIGDIVFHKVCEFFTENKLQFKGIDYVHVNLSVLECMQERLYEKLMCIMDSYGLDYHYINLEITETAAVVSKDVLVNNMNKLISQGMDFSMDDYGTGFSNTATIIMYPFETVKIDKSIVWSAMKDEKAFIVLKHSVAMLKELELYIVAEGVETLDQARCLIDMGCDFLQGFYFSKPLPGEEFLGLLKSEVDKLNLNQM